MCIVCGSSRHSSSYTYHFASIQISGFDRVDLATSDCSSARLLWADNHTHRRHISFVCSVMSVVTTWRNSCHHGKLVCIYDTTTCSTVVFARTMSVGCCVSSTSTALTSLFVPVSQLQVGQHTALN
jgi:hypothetical protein